MSGSAPHAPRLGSAAAVIGAAVLFGTTGTSQALGPRDATPLGIGAVRLVIGAVALLAIAALRRPPGGRSWRPHLRTFLVGGAAVALYQIGWFAGLRRTGVALGTVVGIGSGPVLAGILHRLRGRGGLGRSWLLGTAATVAGAGLLAARGGGEATVDLPGLALVLLAVAGYVLYVELARGAIERGLDAEGAMAGTFGTGAVLLLPLLAVEPLGWLGSARGAGMALHLGIVTVGVAYTLYGWGLRRLSVATAVTLTLAEPLTAALLGTAVLGEQLGAMGWTGAALVSLGLVLAAK